MSPSQPSPPDEVLDAQGEPRWGSYTGPLGRVDLDALARRKGRLFDATHRKRWLYTAIATDELFVGMAITDLTYAASGFLFVARVGPGGRMLAEFSSLGVPRLGCHVGDRPEEGCDAWFRLPHAHLTLRRAPGSPCYDLLATSPTVSVFASLDTRAAPAPHVAIARPAGSEGMVTEKRVLMPVRGALHLGAERHSLDGAVGGIDYSHGFPPRETVWRWGYFMGRTTDGQPLAMNLVQGFNGQPECVVWLGDTSYPLGEGRFSFDEHDPLRPWTIRTDEGHADLTFEPAALHREAHDLGLIASQFVQPIGVYRGSFDIPGKGLVRVDGAPGVAENQRVRW